MRQNNSVSGCNSVGIVILFIYKVLLDVMFKGFKAMLWCRVVACKDNNKVIGVVVLV